MLVVRPMNRGIPKLVLEQVHVFDIISTLRVVGDRILDYLVKSDYDALTKVLYWPIWRWFLIMSAVGSSAQQKIVS